MAQVIIYPGPAGRVRKSCPGPGITVEQIQARLNGLPSVVCDSADLPSEPESAWFFNAESPNGITIIYGETWKAEQRILVEAKKAQVLKGGTPWNDHILFTDDDGWKALAGALLASDIIPEDGIPNWHFMDGDGVVLASDLPGMKEQFFAHTLGCQAVRTAKLALVDAGEDPDIENGWPPNS